MAYSTVGGQGAMYLYKLYQKSGDNWDLRKVDAPWVADLSIFSIANSSGLTSTTPTFSSNSITFQTNRKTKESIDFIRSSDNTIPSPTLTEELYENSRKETTSTAKDKHRMLCIWCSNDEVGTNANPKANLREYVAGVGYLIDSSADGSGTQAGQKNTYTWSFQAVTPYDYELAELKKIVSNAVFQSEANFGIGIEGGVSWKDVQGLIAKPFEDWNLETDRDLVDFCKAITA